MRRNHGARRESRVWLSTDSVAGQGAGGGPGLEPAETARPANESRNTEESVGELRESPRRVMRNGGRGASAEIAGVRAQGISVRRGSRR